MNVKFKWSKDFFKIRAQKFKEAQDYVDSECVKRMEPYVPVARKRFRNAGRLRDSVKIAEPGKIVYTARFSRSDYYSTKNHKHGGNPNAQRLWFEVMKRESGAQILRGAAAIAGGKAKK